MKIMFRQFTLTELLVIITIVCLLAGFLLPALSKTLDRAKLTACSNNLRNIGSCVLMYSQDNYGKIPNILTGMENNSIPVLRLPGNTVLALGRLMDVYIDNADIFGCPDSPGCREEDVRKLWNSTAMVWSAYLYRGQSSGFNGQIHSSGNMHKPYVMDFACITNQGEQFAPHNYLAVNLLYPDCHTEIRRNTREPFKLFTAQAARHGEITPDCTRLWERADK